MTGEQIRRAREEAGLTQEQLGARVGVSLRTVGNWERGATPVSPRQVARVEAALGTRTTDDAVPLDEVSDIELLAEIARRLAGADRKQVHRDRSAPMYRAGGSPAEETRRPSVDVVDNEVAPPRRVKDQGEW